MTAGSDTLLYTSQATDSGTGGLQTVTQNINVVAGEVDVAFLTVFDLKLVESTQMLTGSDLDGGSYFVWNNYDSPFSDTSQNYFDSFGIALLSAKFTDAVPVPAAGFLLMGALGGLAALRRRKTLNAA